MRNNIVIWTAMAAMLCTLSPSRLESADQTTAPAATFEYAGTYGGSMFSIRKVGPFTFVGQGNVLRAFKNSAAEDGIPSEIAHIQLRGAVEYIDSYGSALFVLVRKAEVESVEDELEKKVEIIDIRDPKELKVVTPSDFSPDAHTSLDFAISIDGRQLLVKSKGVSESDGTIKLMYDISNPLKPVLILSGMEAEAQQKNFRWGPKEDDQFKGDLCPWEVYDVRVRKNVAYLLGDDGVQLVDVSSPNYPRYLAQLSIDTTTTALDCNDKYLAVSDKHNVVHIYGLAKPKKPALIKSVAVDLDIKAIQIQNNYLCAGDNNPESGRVKVYDVTSSSTQPIAVSNVDSPYNRLYKTGFAKLLKYRVLNEKYWIDVSSDSDTASVNLDIRNTDPNVVPKLVTRFSAESLTSIRDRPMVAGENIFINWSQRSSQSSEEYISMGILRSGSLVWRAGLQLAAGGLYFFVQGDVLYTASYDNSLVMYKLHYY